MHLPSLKVQRLCLVVLILTGIGLSFPAQAAVIRVRPGAPADPPPDGASWETSFAEPAAALNQAGSGDEVWLAEGTYYGRFEVKSGVAVYGGFAGDESIRDERQPDRHPTVLDAARQAPCLLVLGGQHTTLIDGLVITNGFTFDTAGAGLRVEGATLVLNGVTFAGHQALEGAAVLATNSDLTVTRCRFVQNTSYGLSQAGSHARGAALQVTGGRLHLEGCLLLQSYMYPSFGSGESGLGGAVWLEQAEGVIRGNTWLVGINFGGQGGALVCEDAAPLIERNRFAGISAESGAAIVCRGDSAPLIRNNLFSDVGASDFDRVGGPPTGGAALFCTSNAAPRFIHNTVQLGYGSAVRLLGREAVLRNNIFTGVGAQNTTLGIRAPDDFTTDHNLFFSFSDGPFSTNLTHLLGQNGNGSADPRFLGQVQYGQGRIHPDSPVVNTAAADPDAGEVDYEGRPRQQGGASDLGAVESDGTADQPPYPVIRVRTGGDDAADGSNWADAKRTVAAALSAAAETGGDVWVQAGIYEENLTLPYLVNLLGGFSGTETGRDQRQPQANETVLDGGRRDRVVFIGRALPSQQLSGLTLRRGFTQRNGGGVYCNGSLQITDNRFEDNWAQVTNGPSAFQPIPGGGALYVENASPRIANNIFVGNRAFATETAWLPFGGAVAVSVGAPLIEDNYFTGNQVQGVASTVTSTTPDGSALALELAWPGLVVRNNTFLRHWRVENSSAHPIHVRRNLQQSGPFSRVDFLNNLIAFNDGALSRPSAEVNLTLRGNCFWENGPAPFFNLDPARAEQDGNFQADPRLTGPLANPHLLPDSPCRDAGEPGDWPDRRDLDGGPRVLGGRIDIGADESDGTVFPTGPLIVRVRTDGDDAREGSSWEQAKRTLGAALKAVNPEGGEVWVAGGTYEGQVTQQEFTRLLGGFGGTETSASERNWVAHPTLITLPAGPGAPEQPNPSRLPLLTIRSPLGRAEVSGFTFQGGDGQRAGGLWGEGSPLVAQNRFVANRVTGSVFVPQSQLQAGAALFTPPGSPRIFHNLFLSNSLSSASLPGNASALLCVAGTTARIVNNTFVANGASSEVVGLGNTPGEVFANNILAFNDRGMDFSLTQTRFASNCVWGQRFGSSPGPRPQLLLVDPKLVNARAGDVRLDFDSPMRGAADETFVDETLADLYGQPRRQGDRVDLGAAEGGSWSSADRIVTLVEPVEGSEFTALATHPFAVSVDPPEPPPVGVHLLIGGQAIAHLTNALSGSWSNVIAGTYQLEARAIFSDGSAATSAPVSVTVTVPPDDLPPRFTHVFPENQSTWAIPADLWFSAYVHDPSPAGRIIDFRVFVDGELLASRTDDSPASFHNIPWHNVRRHTDAVVTFQATDRIGAVTTTNITLHFVSPTFYGRYLTDPSGEALEAVALGDDDTVFGNLDGRPWQRSPDGTLTLLSVGTPAGVVTTASPNGQAAGMLDRPEPPFQVGCLFTNGAAIPLPGLEDAKPVAFNRTGTLVAVPLASGIRPRLWREGEVTEMTGFPDEARVNPWALNDAGVVVGSFQIEGLPEQAFRWEAGVVTEIYGNGFESAATAINTAGQIVGFGRATAGEPRQAYLWENGILTPLDYPEPIGSEAWGINDDGLIIGSGSEVRIPLIWRHGAWESLVHQVPHLAAAPESPVRAINRLGSLLLLMENRRFFLIHPDTVLPELTPRLEVLDPSHFLVSLTTPYYLGLDAVLQRSFDLRFWQDVSTNNVFEVPASTADQQFFRIVPRVP